MCLCVFFFTWLWGAPEEVYGFAPAVLTRQEQVDPDLLMSGCFPGPLAQWCDTQQLSSEHPKLLNGSGGLLGGFHHVYHHEVIVVVGPMGKRSCLDSKT